MWQVVKNQRSPPHQYTHTAQPSVSKVHMAQPQTLSTRTQGSRGQSREGCLELSPVKDREGDRKELSLRLGIL